MTGLTSAPQQVAAAYDAIAPLYDDLVREDDWMRRLLWSRYARLVKPGERVLELGCGTGLDTLALARRGVRVLALDLSAEMLARLAAKAEVAGLRDSIELQVGDAAALEHLEDRGFDAVFSAFAALNTVADPLALAAVAARLLRPGGKMLVHLLAPAGGGARRDDPSCEHTATISGQPVRHWVLPAHQAYRSFFARYFGLRRCYALGFLWPRRLGAVLPQMLTRSLGRLELVLGRWPPFLSWGRFVVLELEKRAPAKDGR